MKVKSLIGGMILSFAITGFANAVETLKYTGKPFILNASYKAANIIVLPEPVKSAYSSQKGVKVNFTDENNKLIVVIPNKPSDLVVEGKSGTIYIFNLNPMAMPSQVILVKNEKIKKEKRILFEAKNDVDDVISDMIKNVVLSKAPEGYKKKKFSKVIAGVDVLVVGRDKYEGGSFKIYVADIVNRTGKTIRVREDSKFAEKLALKLSGLTDITDLRAISISKEILKPKDVATIYVIVNDRDIPLFWKRILQRYE